MKILYYNFLTSLVVSTIIYLIKSFVMWEAKNPITLWTDLGSLDSGARGVIAIGWVFYQLAVLMITANALSENEEAKPRR